MSQEPRCTRSWGRSLQRWAFLVGTMGTALNAPMLGGCQGACEATVLDTDAGYDRYEAPDFANTCENDEDCNATGCSGEVCAAEPIMTTCDAIPKPKGSCGCLDGTCRWQTCG